MTIIDADKFLAYLIISKHIDELTCGEVKQAIEMCKVDVEVDDVLDKIKADIKKMDFDFGDFYDHTDRIIEMVCKIIDKYKQKARSNNHAEQFEE